MNDIQQHYEDGQHAALRGCYRALCVAPSPEHLASWRAGYDSVPPEMRGAAPLTGPIPAEVLRRLTDTILERKER